MPHLGLGLGLGFQSLSPRLQSLINKAQPKLLLMAAKADGTSPLTGNQSPWVDKANKVGKNLFDGFLESGDVSGSTGLPISNPAKIRTLHFQQVNPNTEYRVSLNGSNLTVAVYEYDVNKNFIGLLGAVSTFVTSPNAKYVKWARASTDITEKQQLELGTTATAYEPYAKNNAALYNFAGTATSGWDGTPRYIALDGVDDHMRLANSPSLDITTAPLAIGVTFNKNIGGTSGYIVCKNSTSSTDIQYAVLASAISVQVYFEGAARVSTTIANLTVVNVVFYWDGTNIYTYVNGVLVNTTPFTGTLTSRPNMRIGARSANPDGTTHALYYNGQLGTQSIYTNNNIEDILKLEKEISKPYVTWGV